MEIQQVNISIYIYMHTHTLTFKAKIDTEDWRCHENNINNKINIWKQDLGDKLPKYYRALTT